MLQNSSRHRQILQVSLLSSSREEHRNVKKIDHQGQTQKPVTHYDIGPKIGTPIC